MSAERREHPLAKWLYAHFKAGSGTLTKTKAWEIAAELDRLHAVEQRVESKTVQQVDAQRRADGASKAMRDAGFDQ